MLTCGVLCSHVVLGEPRCIDKQKAIVMLIIVDKELIYIAFENAVQFFVNR